MRIRLWSVCLPHRNVAVNKIEGSDIDQYEVVADVSADPEAGISTAFQMKSYHSTYESAALTAHHLLI